MLTLNGCATEAAKLLFAFETQMTGIPLAVLSSIPQGCPEGSRINQRVSSHAVERQNNIPANLSFDEFKIAYRKLDDDEIAAEKQSEMRRQCEERARRIDHQSERRKNDDEEESFFEKQKIRAKKEKPEEGEKKMVDHRKAGKRERERVSRLVLVANVFWSRSICQ